MYLVKLYKDCCNDKTTTFLLPSFNSAFSIVTFGEIAKLVNAFTDSASNSLENVNSTVLVLIASADCKPGFTKSTVSPATPLTVTAPALPTRSTVNVTVLPANSAFETVTVSAPTLTVKSEASTASTSSANVTVTDVSVIAFTEVTSVLFSTYTTLVAFV